MASHQIHPHAHGIHEPAIFATLKGIRAIKGSFAILFATALFQQHAERVDATKKKRMYLNSGARPNPTEGG